MLGWVGLGWDNSRAEQCSSVCAEGNACLVQARPVQVRFSSRQQAPYGTYSVYGAHSSGKRALKRGRTVAYASSVECVMQIKVGGGQISGQGRASRGGI